MIRLNFKQRRLEPETANKISVKDNFKMVQSHFSKKTGKVLCMSDIQKGAFGGYHSQNN